MLHSVRWQRGAHAVLRPGARRCTETGSKTRVSPSAAIGFCRLMVAARDSAPKSELWIMRCEFSNYEWASIKPFVPNTC